MSKGTQIDKGLAKYHQSLRQKQQQITYKNYQDMLAMNQLQNYINLMHTRMATAMYSWLNIWQYVSKAVKPYQMASKVPITISLPKKEKKNESN